MSPIKLRDLCLKNNVTMIQTTPSRFSTLLADNTDFFKNFTDIMVGGEPFPKSLLNKLKNITNAKIFNMYGPTETTVWSTIKDLTNEDIITIGKPISNTTCYILDKNMNLLPNGIYGSLYIGGDGVSSGYFERDELTNQKFISSPFRNDEIIYDTGDLAYFNDLGELIHLGRKDSQVKIRGHRIELSEIENDIIKFTDISDATVISVDSGSKLCAYYISKNEINISDLRKFLSTLLPNYMVPNYFVRMEKFPHTPNGKIDKKALPTDIVTKDSKIVPPRNDIDKFLIDTLKSNLSLNEISIDDSFLEIGGDSLVAIKLSTILSSKFNCNFSVKDIFENPIISDLSDLISSKSADSLDTKIPKAEEKDFYILSSAQKRTYYSSKIAGDDTTLYNIPAVFVLNKKPNIHRLNKCLQELIKRHSSLRTYFEIIDNEIYQKLSSNINFQIEEVIRK